MEELAKSLANKMVAHVSGHGPVRAWLGGADPARFVNVQISDDVFTGEAVNMRGEINYLSSWHETKHLFAAIVTWWPLFKTDEWARLKIDGNVFFSSRCLVGNVHNSGQQEATLGKDERLRKVPKYNDSRVYFIKSKNMGMVKIGTTRSGVESRLDALQTGSADVLELVKDVPGSFDRERSIHDVLAIFRSHGEWFHYTNEVKNYIQEVK